MCHEITREKFFREEINCETDEKKDMYGKLGESIQSILLYMYENTTLKALFLILTQISIKDIT